MQKTANPTVRLFLFIVNRFSLRHLRKSKSKYSTKKEVNNTATSFYNYLRFLLSKQYFSINDCDDNTIEC